MRTMAVCLAVLLCGMGLAPNANAGFFGLFGSTEKWKEEVQLSDGRIIVIERETVRESGGDEWAFNRSGSKPKEYRIRFEYPEESGKQIEWRSTKQSPRTWPEVPLVLDVESGQPVIFSLVAISAGCEIFSKYVYSNDTWIAEPLPEQFERRTTNLLIFDDKDMQQSINLETKRKKNADSHTEGYRQVGPIRKICG